MYYINIIKTTVYTTYTVYFTICIHQNTVLYYTSHFVPLPKLHIYVSVGLRKYTNKINKTFTDN